MTTENDEVLGPIIASPNRKVELTTDIRTHIAYSNSVHIEASNLDVKLRFGLIQQADADRVVVLDQAHVYVSHEQARMFAKALNEILSKIDAFSASQRGATKPVSLDKDRVDD